MESVFTIGDTYTKKDIYGILGVPLNAQIRGEKRSVSICGRSENE